MSIEAVSSSAGVGKATIYRRWSSKEEIVIAAVERFVHDIRIPDTGSLSTDLRNLLSDARRAYTSPGGRLLPVLASAMERHPRLARAVRLRFLEPRRRAVLTVLERARDRGELASDADLDFIHDLMVGPFVYRRLFTGGRIDSGLVTSILEAIMSAFESPVAGRTKKRRATDD